VLSGRSAVGQDAAPSQILIQNVRVFDGTSDDLSGTTRVLIEDNMIASARFLGSGAAPSSA